MPANEYIMQVCLLGNWDWLQPPVEWTNPGCILPSFRLHRFVQYFELLALPSLFDVCLLCNCIVCFCFEGPFGGQKVGYKKLWYPGDISAELKCSRAENVAECEMGFAKTKAGTLTQALLAQLSETWHENGLSVTLENTQLNSTGATLYKYFRHLYHATPSIPKPHTLVCTGSKNSIVNISGVVKSRLLEATKSHWK